MILVSVVIGLSLYVATLLLVVGLVHKIRQYALTPAPLKIPTTPAPVTRAGVVARLVREVVFFESLFKATKWTWLFGWTFHFALVLVLLRHLRYFQEPVWFWVSLMQPFGIYAGFAMLAGLGGLWVRRLFVDRVRYISAVSDHLMLLLLAGIAATGLAMKYLSHTDVVSLKAFILGLVYFEWRALALDSAGDVLLVIHLLLVATLMAVFPFSKLLHAPGLFFSPTRNQVDNPRERRHLAPWAARLDEAGPGH